MQSLQLASLRQGSEAHQATAPRATSHEPRVQYPVHPMEDTSSSGPCCRNSCSSLFTLVAEALESSLWTTCIQANNDHVFNRHLDRVAICEHCNRARLTRPSYVWVEYPRSSLVRRDHARKCRHICRFGNYKCIRKASNLGHASVLGLSDVCNASSGIRR